MTGLLLLLLLLAGDAPATADATQFPGYVRIRPELAVAGQPDRAGLDLLSSLGFRTVVNLRAEEESVAADERARVVAQGLRYVSLPVTAATLKREDVEALAKLLGDAEAGPVLLHCSTGNRAGGLWALLEAAKGVPIEDAIAAGKRAGLKSEAMVEAVRRVATEAMRDRQ